MSAWQASSRDSRAQALAETIRSCQIPRSVAPCPQRPEHSEVTATDADKEAAHATTPQQVHQTEFSSVYVDAGLASAPFDISDGSRVGSFVIGNGAGIGNTTIPYVLPLHHTRRFVTTAAASNGFNDMLSATSLPAAFPSARAVTASNDAVGAASSWGGAALVPGAVHTLRPGSRVFDAGVVSLSLAALSIPRDGEQPRAELHKTRSHVPTLLTMRRLLFFSGRAVVRISFPLTSPTSFKDSAIGAPVALNTVPRQHMYRGHADAVTALALVPRRSPSSMPRLAVSTARTRAVNLFRVCPSCVHDSTIITLASASLEPNSADTYAAAECPAAAAESKLRGQLQLGSQDFSRSTDGGRRPSGSATSSGPHLGGGTGAVSDACPGVAAAAVYGRVLIDSFHQLSESQAHTHARVLPLLPEPPHYTELRLPPRPDMRARGSRGPEVPTQPQNLRLAAAALVAALEDAVRAPLRSGTRTHAPAASLVGAPSGSSGYNVLPLAPEALARWAAVPHLPLAAQLRLWSVDSMRTVCQDNTPCAQPLPLHAATHLALSEHGSLSGDEGNDCRRDDRFGSEKPRSQSVLLAVVGYRFSGVPVLAPPPSAADASRRFDTSSASTLGGRDKPDHDTAWAYDPRSGFTPLHALVPQPLQSEVGPATPGPATPSAATAAAAAAAAAAATSAALSAAWAAGVTPHGSPCGCAGAPRAAACLAPLGSALAPSPLLPPLILPTATSTPRPGVGSCGDKTNDTFDPPPTFGPALLPSLPAPVAVRRSCPHWAPCGCGANSAPSAASAAAVVVTGVAADYDGDAAAGSGPGSEGLWAQVRRRSGWEPYRADRCTDADRSGRRARATADLSADSYWLRGQEISSSAMPGAGDIPDVVSSGSSSDTESDGFVGAGRCCDCGRRPLVRIQGVPARSPEAVSCAAAISGCEPVKEWYVLLYKLDTAGSGGEQVSAPGVFARYVAACYVGDAVTDVAFQSRQTHDACASHDCQLILTTSGGNVSTVTFNGAVARVTPSATPVPQQVPGASLRSHEHEPCLCGPAASPAGGSDDLTSFLSVSAPSPLAGVRALLPGTQPTTPGFSPHGLSSMSSAARRKQSLFSPSSSTSTIGVQARSGSHTPAAASGYLLPNATGSTLFGAYEDQYSPFIAAHGPSAFRALGALPWGAPVATSVLVLVHASASHTGRDLSTSARVNTRAGERAPAARSAFAFDGPSMTGVADSPAHAALVVTGDAWGWLHLWRRGRVLTSVLAHSYASTQGGAASHGVGTVFRRLHRHCPVTALAAMPNGFVSAGADGKLKFWQCAAAVTATATSSSMKQDNSSMNSLELVAAYNIAAALSGCAHTGMSNSCQCDAVGPVFVTAISHLSGQTAMFPAGATTPASHAHAPAALSVATSTGQLFLYSPSVGTLVPLLLPTVATSDGASTAAMPVLRISAVASHPLLSLAAVVSVGFTTAYARAIVRANRHASVADTDTTAETASPSSASASWSRVTVLDTSTMAALPASTTLPSAATAIAMGCLLTQSSSTDTGIGAPKGSPVPVSRSQNACIAIALVSGDVALLRLPSLQPLLSFSLPELVCGPREAAVWAMWLRQSALQRLLMRELQGAVDAKLTPRSSGRGTTGLFGPGFQSVGMSHPMRQHRSLLHGLTKEGSEPAEVTHMADFDALSNSDANTHGGSPEVLAGASMQTKSATEQLARTFAAPALSDLALGVGAIALSPCGCFCALATRAADWQPPGAELMLSSILESTSAATELGVAMAGASALGLANRLPQALPGPVFVADNVTVGSALSPCVVSVIQVGPTLQDNLSGRACGRFSPRLHCVVRAHTAPVTALSFSRPTAARAGDATDDFVVNAVSDSAILLVSSDASGRLVYTRLRDGLVLAGAAALSDGVPSAADTDSDQWPHVAGARGRVLAGGLLVTVAAPGGTVVSTHLPASTAPSISFCGGSCNPGAPWGVPLRLPGTSVDLAAHAIASNAAKTKKATAEIAAVEAVDKFLRAAASRREPVALASTYFDATAAARALMDSSKAADPRDGWISSGAPPLLYQAPLVFVSPGSFSLTPLAALPPFPGAAPVRQALAELTVAGLHNGGLILHSAPMQVLLAQRGRQLNSASSDLPMPVDAGPISHVVAATADADAILQSLISLSGQAAQSAQAAGLDDPQRGLLQRLWSVHATGSDTEWEDAVGEAVTGISPISDTAARGAAAALLSDAALASSSLGTVLTLSNPFPFALTVALSSSVFARHQPALRDQLALAIASPHTMPAAGTLPGLAPFVPGSGGAGGATGLMTQQPGHSPWVSTLTSWSVVPVASRAFALRLESTALQFERPEALTAAGSPEMPNAQIQVASAQAAAACAALAAERARAAVAPSALFLEADAFQARVLGLLMRGAENVASEAMEGVGAANPRAALADALISTVSRSQTSQQSVSAGRPQLPGMSAARVAAETRASPALGFGLAASEVWQRRHSLTPWPRTPSAMVSEAAVAVADARILGAPSSNEAADLACGVAAARVLRDELEGELARSRVRQRRSAATVSEGSDRNIVCTSARRGSREASRPSTTDTLGMGIGLHLRPEFSALSPALSLPSGDNEADLARRIAALLTPNAASMASRPLRQGAQQRATTALTDARLSARSAAASAELASLDLAVVPVLLALAEARREQRDVRRDMARMQAAVKTMQRRRSALFERADELQGLRHERQRAAGQLVRSEHLLEVERLVFEAASHGADEQVCSADVAARRERRLCEIAVKATETLELDELVLRRQAEMLEARIMALHAEDAANVAEY